MNEKNSSPVSDSEWEAMRIVWTLSEAHTNRILRELQTKKDWSDSTIKTLIRHLVQEGWLTARHEGRHYTYTTIVSQIDTMYNEAKSLLNRMCDTHKGKVILKLLEDSPISKDDLMKTQEEINQKEKTTSDMVPCNYLETGSTIY